MGGYDLYGNYYSREIDALNAEMAQCASIDAGIAERNRQRDMERQQEHEYDLECRIHLLEERIGRLERAVGLAAENQGGAPEQHITPQGQNAQSSTSPVA